MKRGKVIGPAGRRERLRKRHKVLAWTVLGLILAVALPPMVGYLYVGHMSDGSSAQAQSGEQTRERQRLRERERAGDNERANFWREVRGGTPGYSAVSGPEANVLIQNGGENWRALRNGPIFTYVWWMLVAGVAMCVFFYLVAGRIKITNGRAGKTIQRWSAFERTMHWFTASLFIILAITGLSLLYGRTVLIPVLGKDGFAAYAEVAKALHNYLGPLFAIGLLMELVVWVRDNFPNRHDVAWFAKGGGFGKAHPSAGRMNGGEKAWFWILATVGVAAVLSGLFMNFPIFEQTRNQMQIANLIHIVSGGVLLLGAFGHIYIGTIGSEGALEGMVHGRVDIEWAKQHHDLWYEEKVAKGADIRPDDRTLPSNGGRRIEPRAT